MAEVHAFRTEEPESGERRLVSVARLTRAVVFASVVAVGASVGLYSLASTAGYVDRRVLLPSVLGMGPLSVASVSATAALAALGAAVLLGVLAWSTRQPVRNFRLLATVLAVLSLALPATIAGPSVAMRLTMAGMHVIVWATSVGVLARLAIRPVRGSA